MAQAPENVTHGGSTTIDDNSSLATTLDESSTSPTISPFTINGDNHTSSILPTASPTINFDEICRNSPDWTNHYGYSCDDKRVQCHDFGSLGRADQHCCKCRPMCCGQACNVTCVTPTLPPTVQYYNFKESKSSSSSSSWNFTPGPRYGALVIVVFFVSIIWCCNREQQSLRRTRRTMNHRRRRQQNVEQSEEISQERHELFCSKFHFETVPSQDDGSAMVRENSTASSKGNKHLPGDSDDESCGNMQAESDLENTFRSVNSSATGSYQPFASLKRTPARGECSICLDGCHAAEIVCIAINQTCNHVYHQECIVEWLKTNDRCPLCRVDLMK